MTEPVVLIERPAEHVALLRINRPKARNALNMETRGVIANHLQELAKDEETRCVIIAGNEKSFAAGADITAMVGVTPVRYMEMGSHHMWRTISGACPKPMIAAVRGFALGGGCELAMICDIIVAGETARFGQPEIKLGLMPGGGGTQRLTRAVGKFRAMKICLTAEPFTGREAFEMGLASEVVPDAEVESRAIALAQKIAEMPPLAAQQIKEVILAGGDAALDTALRLETKGLHFLFSSEDHKEGVEAFFAKRKPKFVGK
jgi:enoyl-CoA hydratase/carnithine racemase